MTQFLTKLNRYMPLFMALATVAVLIQLFVSVGHLFASTSVAHFVVNHSSAIAWSFGLAAALAIFLVLLGLLRAAGKLPAALTRWTWLMDILDRLTNRRALEQRLQTPLEPEVIDAEALAQSLKNRVVGQDSICDDLAKQIRRRLALRQRGKPVGVFLFAGPPGSGKTYLGKVLAGALGRKLFHLDMTQYSSAGLAATSLFGSPKGYVGSDSYGKLTAALRDTPKALILLDEFEKAHPTVHKNFLTAWNDGFVTEASNGAQISTAAAVFVLTTNAAVDTLAVLSKQCANNPDELRRGADAALRTNGFAPEVLSRIDRIFVFNPLQDLDIARVAALEIENMIESYGLSVEEGGIDPQILIDLMNRQKKLGNAASSRDLTRAIEDSIADSLIDAKQQGVERIGLIDENGRVRTIVSS